MLICPIGASEQTYNMPSSDPSNWPGSYPTKAILRMRVRPGSMETMTP
jgi:hypothetical protein